jgi:hypothetical protein
VALEKARRFRGDMFLRNDEPYLRASLSDRLAFPDTDTWGVPLSLDEAGDLAHRAEVQDSIGPAAIWAEKESPDFGGAWIDQSRGGLPVFQFAGGEEDFERGVRERLPADTEVEFRVVERTWGGLLELQRQVEDEREAMIAAGIPLISTAIDTRSNTVVVGIDPDTEETRAILAKRFGPGISTRADSGRCGIRRHLLLAGLPA